jgi:monoamine oxidase
MPEKLLPPNPQHHSRGAPRTTPGIGLEQKMTKKYDALIIGAGHNGLVCAFYLARAGLKVRIVERRDVVGGAAVTEEFHPGFRNSVASYTVSLLQPKVISDMKLVDHGYRVIERPISNFLPQEDGGYLKLGGGLERTQAEFARFSKRNSLPAPMTSSSSMVSLISHTDQEKTLENSCLGWRNRSIRSTKTTLCTGLNQNVRRPFNHKVPTLRTCSRPSPMTVSRPTINFFSHKFSGQPPQKM